MKTNMDKKSAIRLWQKTKYANLVRNASSGKYFARFRCNGKLIWRGLDTDVLSTAAQRLPDKIKEAKDEQELLASGSDPRITFGAAAKMYIERINASPDFKPKTKAYHQERLDAFFKCWPDAKAKAIKDFIKAECIEWRNRFAKDYSPTSFNHTLGIVRSIFEIGIEAGARRDNPAKTKEMKRLSETSKRLRLPEPEQFEKFVQEIQNSGSGHSKPCAELVQFLAFGGFRITEASYITWADCDFARGKITVRGEPETGLKGRRSGESREIPMIPDMRQLLERMKSERPGEAKIAAVSRAGHCSMVGHADAGVRRGKLALRLSDIRPALQQIGRQPGRDFGSGRVPISRIGGGQMQRGGIAADQDGNGVLQFRALLRERGGLSLGGGKFGFSANDVEVVADAAVETAADQTHLLLAQINRASHGGDFRVESAEPEIILRNVGLERQQHIVERRERSLGIGARAFKSTAHTAP
jgi:integrase